MILNSIISMMGGVPVSITLKNTRAFNNIATVTTPAIDTTGSKLVVVTCTSYSLGNFPTISDSLGNVYTSAGTAAGSQAARVTNFYCINPITGSSHSFTAVAPSGYPSISVNVFSGASFTFGSTSSNTGGNLTTISSGSITPSTSNNLLVTGVNYWVAAGEPNSISDGFIITNSIPAAGATLSGATAYKLNSGTTNPVWSWTGSSGDTAAIISSFNY